MNKFRLFSIILYEKSDDYDPKEVLFNIKSNKYYAFILHNKDKDNKGLFKKPHYHIIIRLDNATTISALSKKLGIKENYIQHINNERAYLRYLIHFDDPEKFQYDINEVKTSRLYYRKFKKSFEDLETEEEILQKLFSKIQELNNFKLSHEESLYHLIMYVNSNSYDTIYRRYRQELLNMLY